MSKTYKALAFGLLAALGLAVSAYATPRRGWPPRPTTHSQPVYIVGHSHEDGH